MRAGASAPQRCDGTGPIHIVTRGLHARAAGSSLRTTLASPTLKVTHARLEHRPICAH
ncbi:hypothetical protein EXIGLDRAFT_725995, partial [Exidia glandulosa HHB12029]